MNEWIRHPVRVCTATKRGSIDEWTSGLSYRQQQGSWLSSVKNGVKLLSSSSPSITLHTSFHCFRNPPALYLSPIYVLPLPRNYRLQKVVTNTTDLFCFLPLHVDFQIFISIFHFATFLCLCYRTTSFYCSGWIQTPSALSYLSSVVEKILKGQHSWGIDGRQMPEPVIT